MNEKDFYDDEYEDDIPLYGEGEPDNRPKTEADFDSMASALYDGGWRAEDRDDIKSEYELTDDEADKICDRLNAYDEEDQSKAEEFFKDGWRSKDIDRFKELYPDANAEKIFERIKKLEANEQPDGQRKKHPKCKSSAHER